MHAGRAPGPTTITRAGAATGASFGVFSPDAAGMDHCFQPDAAQGVAAHEVSFALVHAVLCMYVYVCMYECMHACMYVCMYVCYVQYV